MEFINSNIGNRKKLVKKLILTVGLIILAKVLVYLTESEAYQTGEKYSRNSISFNGLMFIIILGSLIILIVSIASRLILRLSIDKNNNLLIVTYIDRFRLSPRTISVTLSGTQIQVEKISNNGKDYTLLYLIHNDFGTLHISEMDFSTDIHAITSFFEEMKQITAAKIRARRKLKRKLKN